MATDPSRPRTGRYRDDPRWQSAQARYIAEHGDAEETFHQRIAAAVEMRLIEREYAAAPKDDAS